MSDTDSSSSSEFGDWFKESDDNEDDDDDDEPMDDANGSDNVESLPYPIDHHGIDGFIAKDSKHQPFL